MVRQITEGVSVHTSLALTNARSREWRFGAFAGFALAPLRSRSAKRMAALLASQRANCRSHRLVMLSRSHCASWACASTGSSWCSSCPSAGLSDPLR